MVNFSLNLAGNKFSLGGNRGRIALISGSRTLLIFFYVFSDARDVYCIISSISSQAFIRRPSVKQPHMTPEFEMSADWNMYDSCAQF